MDKNLYFIKIIQEALGQTDAGQALKKAFEKIEVRGQEPEYLKGYQQFLRFMSFVRDELNKNQAVTTPDAEIDPEVILERVSAQLDRFEPEEALPGLVVEREGHSIATLEVQGPGRIGAVENVSPGQYSIRLDNGRRLWAGKLGQVDLLWREAFKEEPLALAAETEKSQAMVSREIRLLDGEIIVRVIPGRRSGRLEFFHAG